LLKDHEDCIFAKKVEDIEKDEEPGESRVIIGRANPVQLLGQGAVADAVSKERKHLDEGKDPARPEALEVFGDLANSGNFADDGEDAEKAILEACDQAAVQQGKRHCQLKRAPMIALVAAMAGANGFAMMAGFATTHAERLRKVPSIDPKKGKMPIDGTFKNIFKGRVAKARMRYSAPPARSSRRRSMGSRPRAGPGKGAKKAHGLP
jgi:hypothetical protein